MFRNAVRVSGKTPLGTDAAVFPHGQNAKESKLMVDLGMAPIEALKFLTAIDAELFGLVQKVGLSEKASWPISLQCQAIRPRNIHGD